MIIASTLLCLSLTVFHEARNQPIDGQILVAKVVLERSKKTNTTPCDVAFAPYQFSWANNLVTYKNGNPVINAKYVPNVRLLVKQRNAYLRASKRANGKFKNRALAIASGINKKITAWNIAKEVAKTASRMNVGPCEGVTFYHTKAVHPRWSDSPDIIPVCAIADHIFYKQVHTKLAYN